jgi:hypothetical protein
MLDASSIVSLPFRLVLYSIQARDAAHAAVASPFPILTVGVRRVFAHRVSPASRVLPWYHAEAGAPLSLLARPDHERATSSGYYWHECSRLRFVLKAFFSLPAVPLAAFGLQS